MLLALFFTFYSIFPTNAIFPGISFVKVFPEYAFSAEEVERVEVYTDNKYGYFTNGPYELSEERKAEYLQDISKAKVNFDWMIKLQWIFTGVEPEYGGSRMKVVFYLNDGTTKELVVEVDSPRLYRRIVGTCYLNIAMSTWIIPYGY